jgi:hypothetical protein
MYRLAGAGSPHPCQKCIVKDERLPCTEAAVHMAKRFSASICNFFVPFARKDARLTQRRGHTARRIPGNRPDHETRRRDHQTLQAR